MLSTPKNRDLALLGRTIGGGAILDGPWEQDYFVIVNRASPECPKSIPEFYATFMKPPTICVEEAWIGGINPSAQRYTCGW